ncbi:hypothetical protein Acr_13g0002910 [Actinidia rufa]|uniref:Retrovirus-related Pol polyprotein from transposon TNT 1-94-like beta-barrel domain-containing protein n=1 Tax=Actinidia rufa TaxID=165716 RepID=A0A7J0FJM8_9ERIC|nr:hypothetical protein Acr_13g0002910 [Actinidia rufa]
MKDMEEDESKDDWADQTVDWTRGKDISDQSLIDEEASEFEVLERTIVAEHTSEFQEKRSTSRKRDREMFSTYAACEGSVRFHMADGRSLTLTELRHVPSLRKNLISMGCKIRRDAALKLVEEHSEFQVKQEMLRGRKIGGLYRLEGNVRTGEAIVRHESSGTSKKNGQEKQPLHKDTQSKRRGT